MRCETRLVASPWTRNLKRSGEASRSMGNAVLACVRPTAAGWEYIVFGGPPAGVRAVAADREAAKSLADDGLRRLGVRLVNVPGGCTIESDEPKKPQRVYREG